MHKTYYLIRHALATRSTSGYGDAILTAEIIDEGREAIEKMAEYLKRVSESFNVSSELVRCRQTVAIITKITGKKFVFDSRLNEFYQETFAEFNSRVKACFDDLEKQLSSNIVVCTHGAVIAGIKHFLLGTDFQPDDMVHYPVCGELLIIQNKTAEKINFNL